MNAAPNRSFSRWFRNARSMPWWIEYGALAIFLVTILRLRLALPTLLVAGVAYVVVMQILRVLVQDYRGGSVSRSDST